MIALLLNSGLGSRMGDATREHPKCMTPIGHGETILSWQVKLLEQAGITEAVVTTGHLADVLESYIASLNSAIRFHFVHNPRYRETNYIYSMYLARDLLKGQDILSLHGDLVLHPAVMARLAASPVSAATVDTTLPQPEKDFKGQLIRQGGETRLKAVGVSIFGADCVALQPAYRFLAADFARWMASIEAFVAAGDIKVYAENAFNAAWEDIPVLPLDVQGLLCAEIDNPDDLAAISHRFEKEVLS